jgi:thiosulfate/3-mercaptopyruvate sulfurtransferase
MHTTLINSTELASHLTDPDWVIVDCRHDLMDLGAGRAAYASGHIATARFADLEQDLSGAKHGPDGNFRGRHPLPERTALIATLRRWGISDATQVVAYDAHGGMFAARLWWLLRWVGHPAVAVLDGALADWQAQGLPLTQQVSAPVSAGDIADLGQSTSLTPLSTLMLTRTVSAADLLANMESGHQSVIDARAPDRFRGENETIDPVGGHIPGAGNRFFKDNLGANGRFKSAAQLQAEWAPLFGAPANAVMQCGSGVTACHNLLALEVAALPGAALYPGSWSEWCSDPSRPVARGV